MILVEVRELNENGQVQYTHVYTIQSVYKSDFQVVCELTDRIRKLKSNEE